MHILFDMKLDLTEEETRFLREQLLVRAREVHAELVRTTQRPFQRALATDLSRIQQLAAKIAPGSTPTASSASHPSAS